MSAPDRKLGLIAWASLVSLPVVTVALGAEEPAADPGAGAPTLEEVVVTAQKREERLQDVPVAISAVSGEDLEAKQKAEAEQARAERQQEAVAGE